jgi:DNA-binding NarL/FixJ family response regulator
MANPIIRIHDISTGEILDREMTDEEFTAHKADQKANAARQAEAEAKVAARESALAKLLALGLTADEIGAL